MRDAIPASDRKAPSRCVWFHWMKRAFAPHEGEMAIRHRPIAEFDSEPGGGEAETMASAEPDGIATH